MWNVCLSAASIFLQFSRGTNTRETRNYETFYLIGTPQKLERDLLHSLGLHFLVYSPSVKLGSAHLEHRENAFAPNRLRRFSPSMVFNVLRRHSSSSGKFPFQVLLNRNVSQRAVLKLFQKLTGVRLPKLSFHANRTALSQHDARVVIHRKYDNSPLSKQLDKIMSAKSSLSSPSYTVTPWLRESRLNFGFATLRSRLGAIRRRMEPPFADRITSTEHPDVTIEWAKDPIGYALPAEAPIVIFLHTITGTAAQSRWLMKYASLRGWRSCTFVRRGHGGRLHSPSFDILGTVGDVQLQVAAVRRKFPNAKFFAMMGISAGSGQLLSYLGQAGDSTPIGAASGICPAWDTRAAFDSLHYTQPLAEKAILRNLKTIFLKKQNRALLRAWSPRAVESCLNAESLSEFVEAHAPFAMRDHNTTLEAYYRTHDPMADRHGIKIPVLLINAEDDFVCSPDLAKPDVIANEQPGTLVMMTKGGSHVAFNEGLLARDAFHLRTSFDFFDAARESSDVFENVRDTANKVKGLVVPTRREANYDVDRAREALPALKRVA